MSCTEGLSAEVNRETGEQECSSVYVSQQGACCQTGGPWLGLHFLLVGEVLHRKVVKLYCKN